MDCSASPCKEITASTGMQPFIFIMDVIILAQLPYLEVVTNLTFEIKFPASLLTWLWMVSLPVCSCSVSMDIPPGIFVIMLNTMF
jgi:hypothetical protein